MNEDDGKWHLDKKVPISIIAALFVQFMGGIWFMSKLEARVLALEVATSAAANEQHVRDDRQDRATSEAVAIIRAQLDRIDSNIIQLIRENSRK